MRNFDDLQGNSWSAALLSASYGSIMLIFSPLRGDDTRQLLMASAESREQADAQLAAYDDAELRALLAQSKPWDPNSSGL